MNSVLPASSFAGPFSAAAMAAAYGASTDPFAARATGAENAASQSGAGHKPKTGSQHGIVSLFESRWGDALQRPASATGKSVVYAQAQSIATSDTPELRMPDPLPTSPFLKRG